MIPKKFASLILGLTAATALQAQTYCVPPPFTSGPFTGITSVSIGDDWQNTSLGTVGYMYYSDVAPAEVSIGEEYTVSVQAEHTLTSAFSGNLNYRVWIDWNQDGDFEDTDEEVLKVDGHYYDSPAEVTFTVPDDAVEGVTRMRVYEDMLVNEGHDYPVPCGYLSSTNPIGHHGESEDYDIEILGSGGGGGGDDTDPSEWPVGIEDTPSADWDILIGQHGRVQIIPQGSTSEMQVQLTNLMGQVMYRTPEYVTGSGGQTIDLGKHASGIYIIQVEMDGQPSSKKVYIQ